MKILVNDGISVSGIEALDKAGFEVINTKVAQEQLENYINEHNIDAIIVRSATQVRQELIEACPSIKLIARAGVGMDNIDVDYATENGVHVINTQEASAPSVAELVFAHLLGMVRFLHQSNREMPLEGDLHFNALKKQYSQGVELRGKTLGIIGFGHIGQEVAKMALGLGMKIIAMDTEVENAIITIPFFDGQSVNFSIQTQPLNDVLSKSDFITLHLPAQGEYVLEAAQFKKMKDGVGIINTSRGGVLNEVDLVNAIESGKVKYAGLDVYESQPTPEIQLLMNPEISMTPHIGASTIEAQERIGIELANKIIKLLSE
ncbi:D-2-hydroxyacid dehydrogenase [Tenacibaculum caenipelagi]|uniref:D-3-phosphoglycerate dehydrogenase n=1 Tax=Tenacibaculum caenipelagi TaxID=1325435 RepID=A0A4R6TG66_9FLAO|nr:D-2-hydroxyacid dehydrogenase [Tenacibaculum caenipelagi]TDQ25648.1 D-3-phosphoglycerate dehydrogenase [Tenacibaculum caenipelagi]